MVFCLCLVLVCFCWFFSWLVGFGLLFVCIGVLIWCFVVYLVGGRFLGCGRLHVAVALRLV